MLNGVFGKDELLHIAHWKFTDHWEEEEEDGLIAVHDRERFFHELTLIFAEELIRDGDRHLRSRKIASLCPPSLRVADHPRSWFGSFITGAFVGTDSPPRT